MMTANNFNNRFPDNMFCIQNQVSFVNYKMFLNKLELR